MARNPGCTVFIGNLDEKISERVLYEILIQAGHVVDLHIPSDKESNSRKGYAFAEYETEEITQYAVRLFSGLVRINGKTLKFVIAGHDKPSSNGNNSVMLNHVPSSNGNNPVIMPKLNPIPLPKQTQIMHCSDMPVSRTPAYPVVNGRIGGYGFSPTPYYPYGFQPQALSGGPVHSHGQVSNSIYDYNGLEFGSVLNIAHRGPVMNAFAHGAANQTIMHPS